MAVRVAQYNPRAKQRFQHGTDENTMLTISKCDGITRVYVKGLVPLQLCLSHFAAVKYKILLYPCTIHVVEVENTEFH